MAYDASLWNKIMKAALAIPGVAVDRETYLKQALKGSVDEAELKRAIDERPPLVLDCRSLLGIASGSITYHTATVTTLSTITGLPGGPALLASIPADLAQYYYHVFVLAQKMAYLYGFPDMRDEKGRLTEDATDLLTLFVGTMMGARQANEAIRDISRDLAVQIAKKMPQKTLTRAIYYPIVRQIAKRIGIDLSKSSFTKTFGRFIPLLGGLVSGGITYATFHTGALRLQKILSRQTDLLGNQPTAATADPEPSVPEEDKLERIALRIVVNMASMGNAPSHRKRIYLKEQIEHSRLSTSEKNQLLKAIEERHTFRVDISDFNGDPVSSAQLVHLLAESIRLSEQPSIDERIYLEKISRELGYSQHDLEALILA